MANKEKDIVDEVVQKQADYEAGMGNFLQSYNHYADLFKVRRPGQGVNYANGIQGLSGGNTRGIRGYSNPRTPEMFRAVNTLATMMFRMMTANDPYFDMIPMDLLAVEPGRLETIEATLQTQLRLSQHKRYLLKALTSMILFGSVIVEEPFETIGINQFGRRMPLTAFRPRSLLQVAFDRNALDIDRASWVSVADVMPKDALLKMSKDDIMQEVWERKGINEAMKDVSFDPQVANNFMMNRLTEAGYFNTEKKKNGAELITYYGKLDTINDGTEWVVGVANRKHLVKFHVNNFQHGKRQFRHATFIEFELEALGLGLGQLFSPLHRQIDANRQRMTDGIAFDTYGMWLYNRLGGINARSFQVRPQQIVEADDINALKRIDNNIGGTSQALKFEELLKQEFRTASGATDTLQALVSDATATESSLAQNEAVRNVSVKAELAAESLVRDHIEIMHSNNMTGITEPFTINVNGDPRSVYPADLFADIDVRTKVVTDKDYKPERLKKMIETLQILTSIRNQNPNSQQYDTTPLVNEIMATLNINPRNLGVRGQDRLPPTVGGIPSGAPSSPVESPVPGPAELQNTPIGPVLGSP